jgi:hypothetical protein
VRPSPAAGRRASAALLLALASAATGADAVPLAIGEGQVLPLQFERRVEQVAVSDAAVLGVRAEARRVEVSGLRGGAARLTVELEGGAVVAYDVRVTAAARTPRRAPEPRTVELRLGEEKRIEAADVARALVEENGVARVRAERGGVVVTGVSPGQASIIVVDGSGGRTEWTVRVRP